MDSVKPNGLLTLLTDFGTQDGFVAAMKGVILTVAPQVRIVDITHHVPPQDVAQGALMLAEVAPCFPPGTVHVAVVDPGVGTDRQAVAVAARGQIFVGPDNGLLARAAASPRRAHRIESSRLLRSQISATFHGRDIFAPVGAYLASGTPLDEVGSLLERITEITIPAVRSGPGWIEGEVIRADEFGNLLTNIRGEDLSGADPASIRLTLGNATVTGLRNTYGEVPRGELVMYVGSSDFLEVARREGDARHYLGAPPGVRVRVEYRYRASGQDSGDVPG